MVRDNGEIWYRVEGKHGVLNTDSGPQDGPDNGPVNDRTERTAPPQTPSTAPRSSEIGSVVDQLPENSKVVVINNQKMFEAPDGTFYSEVVENNRVSYKVVGK